ncbi:MAG: hypothetical protein OQJ77_02090 [Thiovulaceae bacterium]|jgi:hypothetical protein|nr:hypothetical protein [Sulfurimonadaceae bacterium]MCW9026082.1 hypothetical protein [Sulfurimonadaceae bacterium]
MKTTLLLLTSIIFSIFLTGCFNKHGISAKYYSDCNEYYDLQGYYHKDCGKDDIITYDEIKKAFKEEKKSPKNKNVW